MPSKRKTTATKEEAKPALVPKLRFPEFQGDWERTPIGEKVDVLSGYPFDGSDISEDRNGIRLLRGINITEGRIRHNLEIDRYFTGDTDALEKYRLSVNDLVIGMDGSKVGKNSALISDDDKDALLIQRVARLRTSNPTLIQFIFQQINSTTFHSYVDKINTSSGIPHISAKQIKEFTIGFPSLAEQQKIAECLSTLDKVIAAQARKVDALKTHKKGLMQQLFPREGETQPRLRFPEFQNAGAWEETPLGKVAENLNNRRVPITSSFRKAGEIPYYGASGIVDYVEGFIFDEDLLCVSEDGANLIARTYPIAFSISGKTWVNNHAHVLRFKHACTQKFVEAYLNSIKLDDYLTGMAQPKLNKAMLDRIPILHPRVPEQHRIASCHSSLDALIAAEMQKHAALQRHKRGLMQQLFPSPEANDV